MTKTLRYYQEDALDASLKAYHAGETDQVIVLPTGGGKTVVFVNLPDHHGFTGRVLIVTHTDELAQQSIDKTKIWLPHERVGLEKASSYAADERFVVTSVQSMSQDRRLSNFAPDTFETIILDEAHHSVADQWQKVIKHFKPKLLVRVTATAERGDKVAMGGTLVYFYDVVDAIKEGYLALPFAKRLMSGVNIDSVHRKGEDLNERELSLAMNTPETNRKTVQFWKDEGEDRKTVHFTSSVAHAIAFAEEFNKQGVPARAIYGASPTRTQDLIDFEQSKFKVAVTVMLLTEGWDCWDVSCVLMSRPVRSASLYKQCIGRGLRIPPEVSNLREWEAQGLVPRKKDCLILDVACLTSKHKLQSLPSIHGLPAEMDLQGTDVLTAINKLLTVQMEKPDADLSGCKDLDSLNTYAEMVDLLNVRYSAKVLEYSEFVWLEDGHEGYVLYLPSDETVRIHPSKLHDGGSDGWNVVGSIKGVSFGAHKETLFDAFYLADKSIKKHVDLINALRREQTGKRQAEPITDVQIRSLRSKLKRMGVEVEPEWGRMTKHDGTKLFLRLTQQDRGVNGWRARTQSTKVA